jgi:hypothetical protein
MNSFIIKGEIKILYNKQKLNEFVTTKSALQKILKVILPTEEKDKCKQENTGKNKPH